MYIWLDRSLLGEIGNVPSNDLLPAIHLPLYSVPVSASPLVRLLSVMQVVQKHNFISSILVVAGGVMSLHYKTLTQAYAGCPIVVSHGPAETGKTTAIKAALSLTGEVLHTTYMNRLLLHCFCFLQVHSPQLCTSKERMHSS